jgi:putative nucleotidyltransferase with HDIG domain
VGDRAGGQNRWRRRPILAALIGIGVAAVPVGCSIAVAVVWEHLVSKPATVAGLLLWWFGVLVSSTAAFLVAERLGRRALPLAALLKMTMLFPGRAPKRLALARRTASTRDLARRLEAARSQGLADEPTVAAEKIVALAASLSVHDRGTRGHAERVRALTDLIATELRLHDDDRDRLRWSALLHDIGKLTVHPDTLNKAGPLSPEEWEVIHKHPLEGAKLIAPLAGWLGEWANTIAEHHERYDGGGYPFGLTGKEISLGGRIVAVADSYDVMTSVRSYKKPISPEAARIELAACARKQFDPEIVRAFLRVSVTRLRGIAPFAWLGSLPLGNALPQLARLGAAGGRVVVTGVVAGTAVTGITAVHGGLHATHTAPVAAVVAAQTTHSGVSVPSIIATGAQSPGGGSGVSGDGTATRSKGPATSVPSNGLVPGVRGVPPTTIPSTTVPTRPGNATTPTTLSTPTTRPPPTTTTSGPPQITTTTTRPPPTTTTSSPPQVTTTTTLPPPTTTPPTTTTTLFCILIICL